MNLGDIALIIATIFGSIAVIVMFLGVIHPKDPTEIKDNKSIKYIMLTCVAALIFALSLLIIEGATRL